MQILAAGLIIFFAVHTLPLLRGTRQGLVEKLGPGAYRGLFSVVSLVGFALILYGASVAPVTPVFSPLPWSYALANLAMPVAFYLLAAAHMPNNLPRAIGHPMLLGVLIWSLTHLVANGDLASILIFGCFGTFAVVDMAIATPRKDSQDLPRRPLGFDAATVAIGLAAFWVIRYFHGDLFGAPVAF